VSVVGTRAGKVLRTVKVGQHPTSLVDVVVGGRELLFVANGGPVQPARGSLQVLAVATLRTVKTIRLPYNPSELAASRNGRTVYVGDTDAPRFGVVDAKALKLKRSVGLRGAAPVNALAVSRDGSRLYVATLASTVVLATRTLRQLAVIPADPPGDPLGIAVGPGGLALAVNGQGGASRPSPGTLTVIRGTRHVKSVGPLGYFAGDVALTPNARTTYFVSVASAVSSTVLVRSVKRPPGPTTLIVALTASEASRGVAR
jgi:DNA-binding beta-propeller fold protein YncE